jgi:hypothetical protein
MFNSQSELDIELLIKDETSPKFLKACYFHKPGTLFVIKMNDMVFETKLTAKTGKQLFESFLEFLICGTFNGKYTLQQIQNVKTLA